MSDDRFKEGDVVELKSGSVPMTVISDLAASSDYRGLDMLECRWWNSSANEFKINTFKQSELKQSEPKKCDSDSGSARGE